MPTKTSSPVLIPYFQCSQGYIQSLTTDAQRTSATSLCEIKQTSQLHDHDVVRRYLVHRSTIFCSPGAWEALCSFLVGSHLLLLLILTVKYFEVHAMATQPAREKPLLSPAPASAPQPPSSAKSPGTAVATESRTLLPLPRTRAAPPSVCIVTQSSSHIDMCSCDLAPSSGTIAFGRADGALQLCRFSSAEAVSSRYRCKPTSLQSQYREAYGHSGPVYSCVTSFDGQFVLSGSQDGSVRLWSWRHATGLAAYANHSFPVWHVSFASHHSHFLSSCYDGGVRLFDTRRLTPLRLMAGHMSDVNAARFHPSDAYALSGSHDCTLRLWDIASSGCVRLMLGHKAPVNDVAVGLRSEVAASGSDDETVRLWDLGSGQARATLSHAEPVRQVLFSSNGKIVAAVGTKFIRVWSCDAALTAAGAGSAEAEPLVSCESPVRLVGASFLNDSPILLACGLGEDPVLSAIM